MTQKELLGVHCQLKTSIMTTLITRKRMMLMVHAPLSYAWYCRSAWKRTHESLDSAADYILVVVDIVHTANIMILFIQLPCCIINPYSR